MLHQGNLRPPGPPLYTHFQDGKRVRAKRKFQIVVNVYDQSVGTGPATQIVIAGAVAETFLGVPCRDFSTSHQLRQEVTNKLKSLEGKPAEFCVEKIRQSVVLYAANSVIRF